MCLKTSVWENACLLRGGTAPNVSKLATARGFLVVAGPRARRATDCPARVCARCADHLLGAFASALASVSVADEAVVLDQRPKDPALRRRGLPFVDPSKLPLAGREYYLHYEGREILRRGQPRRSCSDQRRRRPGRQRTTMFSRACDWLSSVRMAWRLPRAAAGARSTGLPASPAPRVFQRTPGRHGDARWFCSTRPEIEAGPKFGGADRFLSLNGVAPLVPACQPEPAPAPAPAPVAAFRR